LRGLHFQKQPYAQTKLVRTIRGRVYDVIVDLRKSSTTFGKWIGLAKESIKVFQNNGLTMFIAELPEYFFDKKGSGSFSADPFPALFSCL
jgi:hypothetical protein